MSLQDHLRMGSRLQSCTPAAPTQPTGGSTRESALSRTSLVLLELWGGDLESLQLLFLSPVSCFNLLPPPLFQDPEESATGHITSVGQVTMAFVETIGDPNYLLHSSLAGMWTTQP